MAARAVALGSVVPSPVFVCSGNVGIGFPTFDPSFGLPLLAHAGNLPYFVLFPLLVRLCSACKAPSSGLFGAVFCVSVPMETGFSPRKEEMPTVSRFLWSVQFAFSLDLQIPF